MIAALPAQNRLLRLLSADEYARLLPHLEMIDLQLKQVIHEPETPLSHVYFPCTSVLSWLTVLEDGSSVEVATIGHEGMTGIRVLLGAQTSPAKVIVQIPGTALRVSSAHLRAALREGALMDVLQRYVNAFLTQVTQSVACNTLHPLAKRLARWLLMTHDRVQADRFALTHELLALMLGVRRASVTEVARKLQDAGFIRYIHGKITVLDRAGLESVACECYRAVKRDFDVLLS